MLFIETLGIIATLFIIVSFLFKDLKTVRSVNMVGSFLFICYGIALVIATGTIVGFISILLVNSILLVINACHLIKLRDEKIEALRLAEERYINRLLETPIES